MPKWSYQISQSFNYNSQSFDFIKKSEKLEESDENDDFVQLLDVGVVVDVHQWIADYQGIKACESYELAQELNLGPALVAQTDDEPVYETVGQKFDEVQAIYQDLELNPYKNDILGHNVDLLVSNAEEHKNVDDMGRDLIPVRIYHSLPSCDQASSSDVF